jgi:hypothetical protein
VIGFLSLREVDMVLKGAFVTPRGASSARSVFLCKCLCKLCLQRTTLSQNASSVHPMMADLQNERLPAIALFEGARADASM